MYPEHVIMPGNGRDLFASVVRHSRHFAKSNSFVRSRERCQPIGPPPLVVMIHGTGMF